MTVAQIAIDRVHPTQQLQQQGLLERIWTGYHGNNFKKLIDTFTFKPFMNRPSLKFHLHQTRVKREKIQELKYLTMKMIVIFYPHIDEYGGIERNIIGLAMKTIKMNLRPVLLCFYDKLNMRSYYPELETVELGDHWNPLIKSLRLQRWLRANRENIMGLPLFFSGKAGFYAAVLQMKPYPYVLHFTDPVSLLKGGKQKKGFRAAVDKPRAWISSWLMAQGVMKASVCLTMTHRNAEELKEDYGRNFDVVFQGGVPPVGLAPSVPRCHGNTLRLFSICRLTYSKNLDWILSTAAYLLEKQLSVLGFDTLEVVIAGKGPALAYLKTRTEELAISKHVYFPGFLSPEEMEEQYQLADLFLVPGKQGYGLPILEALYRRVPVVQNKESRISELLQGNAWVAITEDAPHAFTQAVVEHVAKMRTNYPDEECLSTLQTEEGWAVEIGDRCNWWR